LEISIKYKIVDEVPEIQFLLISNSDPRNLRDLNSNDVGRLISISGIIVSCTSPSIKGKILVIQCKNCAHMKKISIQSGFGGVTIPRVCENAEMKNVEAKNKCPLDSYIIIPEMCEFIDQQILKIQETPESIPTGEIPRSFQLYCERYIVNKATPGTRLCLMGIYLANEKNQGKVTNGRNLGDMNQKPYVKVVGLQLENQKSGKSIYNFSNEDEQKFDQYSKDPSNFILILNFKF
jgi:DNA replication licensing factor MCM5